MTDIRFLEIAEDTFGRMDSTILEFNSSLYFVLVYNNKSDALFLFRYDYFTEVWLCLRCVPNTNQGFQYIMDLYQMCITDYDEYKKR